MGTNGASVLDGLTAKQITRNLSAPAFVEG